ncbi:MAG: ABC transporter substrate-binding protein [Enterocloster asparagiformis]|nr:ABC transporter substrate-binding protein [Enterocloster asparagiformis]
MKKRMAAALILAAAVAAAGCGAKQQAETPAAAQQEKKEETGAGKADTGETEASAQAESDMPWKITPLAEPVKLKVGNMASTSPHLPTYIAQQKGWLDAVGLEVESVLFNSGPAMMEACSAGAWDCGSTGIGGVITGVLGHDVQVLAPAARDEGGHQAFFARKDSPIVQDGQGHGTCPEVYGTAESWKGKEIFCAKGTTNHFTLYKTLESLGMTLDDVNVVNMEVSSANTAFKAGQGDVVGVWGPLVYSEDKADLVMVSSDAWVKTGIVTNYVANPKAWEEKEEAITKWLEVCIMTGEWIQEHQEEAAVYMTQMYEEDGYPSTDEENLKILQNNPFCSLEYDADIVTMNSDNTMIKMAQQTYDAMSVFVKMGNYTQEQLETLKDSGNFLAEPVQSIAAEHK